MKTHFKKTRMINRILLSLIAVLCLGPMAAAQNMQVSGTVTGQDGQPIVGATVVTEQGGGNPIGTTTGSDGTFSISVPADATLIVSFIGYESQTVPVAGKDNLLVTLQETSHSVDDVIVVAYGTSTKEAFTGSATQIKGGEIAKITKESVDKGMVGRMAGVRVGSDNGDPGSAGAIQIRGVGSISASSQPLYVVDGVVMGNTSSDIDLGFYKSTNLLSSMNPDDIESVTVLKDAAAASLYGSRAANGVVLITTKRGKTGATKINYSGEFGVQNRANTKAYEMMNGKQFIQYLKDGADNAYAINPALSFGYTGDEWAQMVMDPSGETSTNWTDEVFGNAFSHSHQLSMTAGNDKTQIYAGLGYHDAEGIVLGSYFERFSGRLNVDHQVKDWLKLGLRQAISVSDSKGVSDQSNQEQGMGYASPIGVLTGLDPTAAVKNDDGSYNEEVGWNPYAANPHLLFDSDLQYNKFHTMRSTSNVDIAVKFCDKLSLTNTFGFDYVDNKQSLWWAPSSIDGGDPLFGLSAYYIFQLQDISNSTILRYSDTFGDQHHLSALAGFELADHKSDFIYSASSNYPNDKLPALSVGQPHGTGGYQERSFMLSFLASANYDYAHKYYLSASWRRDGSSRLGKESRWADFYSVSGAWRLSEEEFMKDSDLFTNFKVKASYGTNGNLPSSYYAYKGLYSATGGYGSQSGIYWSNPDNPNLGWEKSQNFNVGFEWTMYDRVTLSAEYYNKLTSSLLFRVPSSAVTGFDVYWSNLGKLKNNGVEIEVSSQNIRRKNFSWTTDFNFTYQRSLVKELPDSKDVPYGDGNMYIHREGESMYTFYLPEWKGVNPDTGMGEFWIDPSDHSKGTTNYYTEAGSGVVGKGLPDFLGGMTNTFRFCKHFDLSLLISYQFGGDLFDYPGYFTHHDGFRNASTVGTADAMDYWTPDNRDAKYPMPICQNPYRWDRFSSRLIKSTDNIRMREITLGYDIPVKRYFEQLRVYFKTTNPFMIWSATPDIDPDVPINGYRTADVPVTRSFVFGLNMSF